MASLCSRNLACIPKIPVGTNILNRTAAICQNLRIQQINRGVTWSQLKYMHSRSELITTHHFSYSSRTRQKWRWLAVLVTAGFSQNFLGFSFGQKDEKDGDPLLRVYRQAKEAHAKQDFNTAEIRYHDALMVADEMRKLKKINMQTFVHAKTNIFDSLADMALAQGQLEKAEGLYKETLKGCLQQGLARDDNAVVEISVKLASMYAMMDRHAEAEQGLLFCINTQQAKLSAGKGGEGKGANQAPTAQDAVTSTQPDRSGLTPEEVKLEEEEKRRDTESLLGMALETYGRVLMGQRRLSEALVVLERAVAVAENVLGKEKTQYIILVNDLATVHILLKNFDQAAAILNAAIIAATKASSPQLPLLYCNLGALHLRTSKIAEAEAACLKGKELSGQGRHGMAFAMSQKCLEKIAQVQKNAK